MSGMWWALATLAANWFLPTWIAAGTIVDIVNRYGREPNPWALWIYHELRPLYLPAVCLSFAYSVRDGLGPWEIIWCVIMLASYWADKGDDGRWRRRARKLAEKVTRSGSRLAVVSTDG